MPKKSKVHVQNSKNTLALPISTDYEPRHDLGNVQKAGESKDKLELNKMVRKIPRKLTFKEMFKK